MLSTSQTGFHLWLGFLFGGNQAKQLPLARADDDEGGDGSPPQGGDYDLLVLVLNVCGHTVNV